LVDYSKDGYKLPSSTKYKEAIDWVTICFSRRILTYGASYLVSNKDMYAVVEE
jgi:threonine aldolase